MTARRLQHTSVPRPSGNDAVAQAVRFYRDVLGGRELPLPRTFGEIDVTWFAFGDDEIHVYAADAGVSLRDTGAHFCLVVDDLRAMQGRLQQAGYRCEDTTPIPGRPRFYTFDPFGNQIEITAIEGDYRTS